MSSRFDESGACDACGKERKLRGIQSGQRLCRRCFQELRPPRPKHLASHETLEAFRLAGMPLPEESSRVEVEELGRQTGVLRELVSDVWYTLRGTSPRLDAVPEERLTRFVYDLLQTGEFGRTLVAVEAARIHEGNRRFGEAWRAAAAKLHPTLELFDGRLLDQQGRALAYFNFKPPLGSDGTYRELVELLRARFPEHLGLTALA